MTRLKSVLCLLLAAMTVVPLVSCSNDVTDTTSADTTTAADAADASSDETDGETTTARLYPDVPDTDWEGENFHVLGRDSDRWQFVTFEVYAESENGEVVNDAIFRRNRDIEEKYNVTISQNLVSGVRDEVSKLVAAGEDVYDSAFMVQLDVASSAQGGNLVDLYTLPYIDFGQPWWNAELNDRISILNKLYFTTSDLMLVDKQRTYILFFNRDMVEDYSLDNPFEIVRDGAWTIDKMIEMSEAVAEDLDGDGDMDQFDRFGTGFEHYHTAVLTFGSDNVMCGKDDDDTPILMLNTPHLIESIDKILQFVSNKDIMFFVQDYQGKYDGDYYSMSSDMFKAGNILFHGGFPQGFKEFSAECVDEYGVLPYPKYDEEQEKHYTLSAQASLITVPRTVQNLDFVGFMLEVMSAYASYTSLPAYYEVACKTKYTYDADSAEMLDLTFDGLVYDLGQLYDWGGLFNDIAYTFAKSLENNFASIYASKETSALEAIEMTLEAYRALD